MAIVVKWLTHLAVNQTFVGSIPIGRPNLQKKGLIETSNLFLSHTTIHIFTLYNKAY